MRDAWGYGITEMVAVVIEMCLARHHLGWRQTWSELKSSPSNAPPVSPPTPLRQSLTLGIGLEEFVHV